MKLRRLILCADFAAGLVLLIQSLATLKTRLIARLSPIEISRVTRKMLPMPIFDMSEYSLTPLFVMGPVGAMCERKEPGSFDRGWFETASTAFSFIVALMMKKVEGWLEW